MSTTLQHVGRARRWPIVTDSPYEGSRIPARVPTVLDPTSFSARGMAHPRPGQVGRQEFFTASGRPFCLYVVISGARAERGRRLAALGVVLRSLRIS